VNAVHPGGAAQEAHRDYHLGFMEADTCARYPASTQAGSLHLNDFKQICSRTIDTSTYPLACTVERNVPIYDLAALEAKTVTAETRLQDE
jgi:hypothetical protein